MTVTATSGVNPALSTTVSTSDRPAVCRDHGNVVVATPATTSCGGTRPAGSRPCWPGASCCQPVASRPC